MSVPDFQTLMLPVLKQLAAGGEQPPATVREAVATALQLRPEDFAALLPSGRQTTFANRVAWALGYLKQAGLLESPRRGVYRLTDRGRAALSENVDRVDVQYLMKFPEFVAFRTPGTPTQPEVDFTVSDAGQKIVEHDLLVRANGLPMPCLTILTAPTDVCEGVHATHFDPVDA